MEGAKRVIVVVCVCVWHIMVSKNGWGIYVEFFLPLHWKPIKSVLFMLLSIQPVMVYIFGVH